MSRPEWMCRPGETPRARPARKRRPRGIDAAEYRRCHWPVRVVWQHDAGGDVHWAVIHAGGKYESDDPTSRSVFGGLYAYSAFQTAILLVNTRTRGWCEVYLPDGTLYAAHGRERDRQAADRSEVPA